MKKKLYLLIGPLLAFGMLLGACGADAPATETHLTEVAPISVISIAPRSTIPLDYPSLLVHFWESIPADKNFGLVSAIKISGELASNGAPFLLDVREATELEKDGYIAGSVNIPLRALLQNLDKLPDLNEAIVIFCGSEHRGGFALMALKMLGYTNVRNMGNCRVAGEDSGLPIVNGGLPDAPVVISTPTITNEALFIRIDDFLSNLPEDYFAIKPDALSIELASGNLFLLDVRLQAERDADGYIESSVLVPFPDLLKRLDQLPTDKGAHIIVHCTSGHRGSIATMALRLLGYTNVVNLAGGLNAWKADGRRVAGLVDWESALDEFISNLPSEQNYYSISADELNAVRAEQPVFLVDVRKPIDVETSGHIKGAINIPVRDLLKNLDKLPAKDQKIVVYCEPCYSGAMGMIALRLLGYTDVINLDGGVGSWMNAGFTLEPGVPAPARVVTPVPEVDPTRLTILDAYLTAMPEDFSTVTMVDLNAEIANGTAPLILDVRSGSDIPAGGSFENAILLPVHKIPENLEQLPSDKSFPIVIICKSGHCGAIAKMYLNFIGYIDVRILLAE